MDIIHNFSNYWMLYVVTVISFVYLLILLRSKYDLIVLLNVFLLSVASFEPSPSDLLFIFLLMFSFINLDIVFQKIRKLKILLSSYYIYILINILTFFWLSDFFRGIKFLSITVYLIVYSIFILLYSSAKNYQALKRAYIASSTFSAVLGILGYLGYFSSILRYDSFRIKALFKDPNVFGPFIVPAIILLIHDFRIGKIILNNRLFHICLIVINTVGLVLSFSRGAWLNFLFSLIIYIVLNAKKMYLFRLVTYCVICLIIICILWTCVLNSNFKDFLLDRSRLQRYDINRFTAQKLGFLLAMKKTIGYGPGQYEITVADKMNTNFSAHSLYMRLLLENGPIGFLLFIIPLIYIYIKLLFIHIKGDKSEVLTSSVLIAIMSGILLSSIAIDTLHWRHFWLYVGLSLSVIVENECIEDLLSKKEYIGAR